MIPLFRVFMSSEAGRAVSDVLASGYIGQGPCVDAFEAELAAAFEARTPLLTTNSCTSALDLALHACGVRPDDEVITTPQTCTATNGVIVRRGAIPVWADIDPATGLIDHTDVRRKLSSKTKAIMAVDWGGAACDYATLKSFGVPVIEDAAHALLAKANGTSIAQAGGDYVCWSFQAIKHLTAGDGGALRAPEASVERLRLLRWYGLDRRSNKSFRCQQDIQEVGYKYHMNDISATIGRCNLTHANRIVGMHRSNAEWYARTLAGVRGIALPPRDADSSWWLYTLLVEDRASFERFMRERGVDVSQVHARNDTHRAFQAAAARSPLNGIPLPGVDHFSARAVAIPVGWWLTPEDRTAVAEAVMDFTSH